MSSSFPVKEMLMSLDPLKSLPVLAGSFFLPQPADVVASNVDCWKIILK